MSSRPGTAPVLIAGSWLSEPGGSTFTASDPSSGQHLGTFPVSDWSMLDQALDAGVAAFAELQGLGVDALADFLRRFADGIDGRRDELAALADTETRLGVARFVQAELPRTSDQLRQAAEAVVRRNWHRPVVSPRHRIASMLAPISGPVVVIGPNNFPFAFNSVSGGDAATALATGHPIIAKANPGHPGTTLRLAEIASSAAAAAGVPPATVQLVYRTSHEDGRRLVADRRVAATAFTGSRSAALDLKSAADAAGKPIYLEMSSINPLVVLPDAVESDADAVVAALSASLLAGSGQFCTSPGLVFVLDGPAASSFVAALGAAVEAPAPIPLLSRRVVQGLEEALSTWTAAGAEILTSAEPAPGFGFPNTLLSITGMRFLEDPETFQREAFGNLAITVTCRDADELLACLAAVEGNLTGSIFGRGGPTWGVTFTDVASVLRPKVGRLLADKAPTGVAVVDAMNHGGPYPSTGHPGFTAVGIPSSLERFCMLQCFDNVPDELLPEQLQAANPLGLQRRVDRVWTRDAFEWGRDYAES